MTNQEAMKRAVVFTNMKVAFFDAIPGFNYFRPDYEHCEEVIDKNFMPRVKSMSVAEINFLYESLCDGDELFYVREKEEFTLASLKE